MGELPLYCAQLSLTTTSPHHKHTKHKTVPTTTVSAQADAVASYFNDDEAALSSSNSRELQGFDLSKLDVSKLPTLPALGLLPPGVQLPPLKEFLPPLDSINLPPLNDFLKSVGLPTWQDMNLPPISEFMKPVFDPTAVQLPNLQVGPFC